MGFTALAAAPAEARKVVGSAKADKLKGTNKSDTLVGKAGADKLVGKGQADKLKGGGGKDKLKAGSGKDKLIGGGGKDVLAGGKGKDTLKARDGVVDRRINGGPGKDRCVVDEAELDRVIGCEKVVGVPESIPGDPGGGGGETPTPTDPGVPTDPSPEDPAPLTITSFTGAECASPLPSCPFTITGEGASAATGTVDGGDGVTLAAGAAISPGEAGSWSATGLYGCTDDGFLRITIATQSVDAPIACDSLLGGDAGNGPLTITSSSVDCTPAVIPITASCAYSLAGTGADAPAGVLTGSGGLLVSVGAATATGSDWTATGTGLCTGAGSLAVTIGGESVSLPVDCPV